MKQNMEKTKKQAKTVERQPLLRKQKTTAEVVEDIIKTSILESLVTYAKSFGEDIVFENEMYNDAISDKVDELMEMCVKYEDLEKLKSSKLQEKDKDCTCIICNRLANFRMHNGEEFGFCSDKCYETFDRVARILKEFEVEVKK